MDLYIKFIIGILSTYAIVILNFAIFKIQIRGNDKQIIIIALCVGVTNVYLKFVQDSSVFFIAQSVVYILLLTLLRRYPLFYSTIVHVTVSVVVAVVEALASLLMLQLKVVSTESLEANIWHFIILHSIVSLMFLLTAYVLVKNKIGFSFVIGKFKGQYYLKKSTYVWATILIIATGIIQIVSQQYKIYSINNITVFIVVLLFIIVFIFSYFQNTKSLIDRYGVTKKASL